MPASLPYFAAGGRWFSAYSFEVGFFAIYTAVEAVCATQDSKGQGEWTQNPAANFAQILAGEMLLWLGRGCRPAPFFDRDVDQDLADMTG